MGDKKEGRRAYYPNPVAGQVHTVRIPVGRVMLDGDLGVPENARGVVLFAHGSGSSRHSPREIVPGATHLFEEPGALEQVARLAREWFDVHLSGRHSGTCAA